MDSNGSLPPDVLVPAWAARRPITLMPWT